MQFPHAAGKPSSTAGWYIITTICGSKPMINDGGCSCSCCTRGETEPGNEGKHALLLFLDIESPHVGSSSSSSLTAPERSREHPTYDIILRRSYDGMSSTALYCTPGVLHTSYHMIQNIHMFFSGLFRAFEPEQQAAVGACFPF